MFYNETRLWPSRTELNALFRLRSWTRAVTRNIQQMPC